MTTNGGVPVLIGTNGWVTGEHYVLKEGESTIIGRSRSCDISLRRIVAYLERAPGDRDNDHDFNTVSRRHIRILITGGTAQIEDLSTNGTYCNDKLVSEPKEVSLSEPVIIRLGTRESFKLEIVGPDRLEKLRDSAPRSHDAAPELDDAIEGQQTVDHSSDILS